MEIPEELVGHVIVVLAGRRWRCRWSRLGGWTSSALAWRRVTPSSIGVVAGGAGVPGVARGGGGVEGSGRCTTPSVELEQRPGQWTEDDAAALAAVGGVAGISPHRIDTTMTVDAADPPAAGRAAIGRVAELLGDRGEVVALEVLTIAEHDRRLAEHR